MLQTYMHLPENKGWLLLPRPIKKKVLSTINKHVMHATNICASIRKCGLDAFAKIYQERSAEYVDQTCNACYKYMNLQEKLLPSHIKKEVLSTMIQHVMHAAIIYASTNNHWD